MLLRANPQNNMNEKLEKLFNKYPSVPIKYIGIPSDEDGIILKWQNEPLWQIPKDIP